MNLILPDRERVAAGLLILFAFAAWSLTGLANVALGLLSFLFLLDLPRNWARLRRDPGFLLMLAALGFTALLALRAAWLLPDTAPEQWGAIGTWTAPFLFVVAAWWSRGKERLTRMILVAAALGLVTGVLRKADWSLLDQILHGLRYHFGYAALGLAFLVSVMLAGLVIFRRRILGMRLGGRRRPILGWTLWSLGVLFTLAVLVVIEARGSALSLTLVALGSLLLKARGRNRHHAFTGQQRRMAIASVIAVLALMSLVIWSSRERIYYDWRSIAREPVGAAQEQRIGYDSSSAVRLNLYRLGLELFAARPLLGWGPGTSGTEYLVPNRVIPLSELDVTHASQASHLHSLPIEILVRFGLAGIPMAALVLWVLAGAYRLAWKRCQDPELREFLVIGGVLTLLFCLYDFRITHLDLRFFFIAFFGIVYGYGFAEPPPAPADVGTAKQ